MKEISTLPLQVRVHIMETLKAYDEVTVTYENGEYHYGLCIKSHYAPDHEFIGVYKANELYTLEQRTENYMQTFHDYPIWYKGKRDYKMLREKYGYC